MTARKVPGNGSWLDSWITSRQRWDGDRPRPRFTLPRPNGSAIIGRRSDDTGGVMPADDFAALLARVRSRDPDAAAELVRRYEPAIRVAVRANLVDPNLRRHFDSMDICQSVLGSFFVRAAAGQYDLADPAQLVGLLARMTRNKVAAHARDHRRAKRDARRDVGGGDALGGVPAAATGPEEAAAARELLSAVLDRLGGEEREIAQRRALGQEWVTIAAEMGGTADGRRKQLARAIDRLSSALGLDGSDDE